MKSRPRSAWAVLIAVGTVACQQDDRILAGLGSEVRDSAGIQIVENVQPHARSRLRWRIGPQPTVGAWIPGHLDIGAYFAGDATKLGDGRIVVAHSEGHLPVFDASGELGWYWGGQYAPETRERTGERGEYVSPDGVAPLPGDSIVVWGNTWEGRVVDTLYVFDEQYGVSVFDTAGNFSRFVPLPIDERDVEDVNATSDGSILVVSNADQEDSVSVQVWSSEGELRSSLGMLPAVEFFHLAEYGPVWYAKIFGSNPVSEPWAELVVVGNTSRYELRAFRVDGSLARIVRREHMFRSPTPEDVAAAIEMWVAADDFNSRRDLRRHLRSVPVADHLPAFDRVMSDASGHLWVEEYRLTWGKPSPLLWTVFDPEGKVLGFVETPAGLRILEIGEDYILGTTRDERHVEHCPPWLHQHIEVWPLAR